MLWTAMPGIVEAVDFSTMTCTVQPAIQGIITDQNGKDTFVNLPLLVMVPIVFPSAGGFTITMPLKINDEVLVVFSSRCIDSWWQSGGIQVPAEQRMHDLSDGFCIPGPKSVPHKISNISSTALQIRNNAGTSYVEISATGQINLVSTTKVTMTAPEVDLTGNLIVTGDVVALGVSLTTHIHSGVTTGPGDSGPPV